MISKKAKRKSSLVIQLTPATQAAVNMLQKEWLARADALSAELPHWAAHAVLKDMLAVLPKSAYSKALGVGTLGRRGASVFLDTTSTGGRRVKLLHADSMILIVKSRKSRNQTSKAVQVLERYNPWTTRTLPFVPDKKEADIISQKAKSRQISQIEKRKRATIREYTDKLNTAGIKPSSKKTMTMALLKGIKTIPDLAMEGAALEFGLKRKAIPHWKPALTKFIKTGAVAMARRPDAWRSLMDPAFRAWVKWPNKERRVLSLSDTRKFAAFCRMINISSQQ